MRCCSILAIVAMAFVPSAFSATGSQPLKKDSAGILPLADEVRSFSPFDLCIFCDVLMVHQLLQSSPECINVNIGNSGSGSKQVTW
jgi:hypothetical protein